MWTLAYRAAWAAARGLAPLLARGDGKLARSVRGRLEAPARIAAWAVSARDTARPLVWFHAASVGEGRQAEAVLRRLHARHPDWQIAWTHSSPSAERLAASLPADLACYVPADTPRDAAAALDALRPAALVFSATDLWPELVRQAHRRGVRIGLISATLAPTSSRQGKVARALLRETWEALDAVGAIDPQDAERLKALGVAPDRIAITGDTRHDAAQARVTAINRDLPALRLLAGTGGAAPLLVAGSTWPADERELLPALARAREHSALRVAIAPHEPDAEHLATLERRITELVPGASTIRLSTLETAVRGSGPAAVGASALPPPRPPAWDLCLIDRVGILADLYAAAAFAFVGGGFHTAGLHSVIEPAALGVPVLFGPRWQSSRDARLLLERGGGRSVADGGELARALDEWLANDAQRATAGRAARAVLEAGLGAAERSVELVERMTLGS